MRWLLVPLAFAAMFIQDVLCVWLVRAENQGRGHAAGCWDMLQGLCSRAGQYTGFGTLFASHDIALAAAVQAATSAADYLGTRTGVALRGWAEQRKEESGREA